MQAVILAAGESSRFYPYNKTFHKAFSVLAGKTILEHTIRSIKQTGITDIILITTPDSNAREVFGDGKIFGVNLTYVVQPKPLGMGDALLHAKEYLKDVFYVTNASHIDFAIFKKLLEQKKTSDIEIVLLAKESTGVSKYGFINIDGGRVTAVTEKPGINNNTSNIGIIGIYLLNKNFIQTLESVKPSQYSFESALSVHAGKVHIAYVLTKENNVSLKYPWDLFCLQDFILKNLPKHISHKATIAKNVIISGNVKIEDGVEIMEGVVIKGPCYLGKNVFIGNNAIIRGGVIAQDDCIIGANMELKHSILFEGATTHSGFIGDSIIGRGTKIGANFTAGNVRLDRGQITAHMNENKIATGLHSLGVIIGDNSFIGLSVSVMPGVIIGNNVVVGPSSTVFENIPDESLFYTKLTSTVKRRI